MNRSLSLHPVSLVLGIALCAICFFSMSQVAPLGQHPIAQHVVVGYGPDPRDYVQIREGTPFTVPPGKLFVLTGLGSADALPPGTPQFRLRVNGQVEVTTSTSNNESGVSSAVGDARSVVPVAPGFTAPEGSVIDVQDGSLGHGRAWGYLAPQ